MDLLDFESQDLYFDKALSAQAQDYIELAAEKYAEKGAELPLLRAYFLEPEHPTVLVALYRYFYYQHRLSDALLVSERVLAIYATLLKLPEDWKELTEAHLSAHAKNAMTTFRFYLLALKGAAYLEMRLGKFAAASTRLHKLVELDDKDHLGAQALLSLLESRQSESDSINV